MSPLVGPPAPLRAAGRGAAPGAGGGRRAEGREGGTEAGAEGGEREEMGHPQPGQKGAARCLEGHEIRAAAANRLPAAGQGVGVRDGGKPAGLSAGGAAKRLSFEGLRGRKGDG